MENETHTTRITSPCSRPRAACLSSTLCSEMQLVAGWRGAAEVRRWVAPHSKSVALNVNLPSKTTAHIECLRRRREPNESFNRTRNNVAFYLLR